MKDYKLLAETMYKRKSVRDFSKNHADILENNTDLIDALGIQSLIGSIKVKVKVLRKGEVSNERSDYCIAFYSEDKPLYLENIGFIGQQIDLELQSRGLGTCWWGMKKPKRSHKNVDGLSCAITMTAGCPLKVEMRKYPDEFDRKKYNEIVIGDVKPDQTGIDNLIEAIRIAPSAVNLQPWLIEKIGKRYNFYIKKPKSMMEKMIGYMRNVDMGIAMAHMFVQAQADGSGVSFTFDGNDIEQGKYIGTAYIES